MINEFLTSVIHRPYVFIFLASYLVLAKIRWGTAKTLIWLVSGYAIAWLSEYSSINTGFPYGEYHYIYANMPGELMIAGVPFFDSLSYPFMIFAGFTTAALVMKTERGLKVAFLGAIFTTLLDVIIDPISKLGSQWFLGEIYYYVEKGFYFGVPFSNFAGWFLVSLAVILFNQGIWQLAGGKGETLNMGKKEILYPAFYAGIGLFGAAIAAYISAYWIFAANLIIVIVVMIVTMKSFRSSMRALP